MQQFDASQLLAELQQRLAAASKQEAALVGEILATVFAALDLPEPAAEAELERLLRPFRVAPADQPAAIRGIYEA